MNNWLKGALVGLIIGIILSGIYFFIFCWSLHNCGGEYVSDIKPTCGNPYFCDLITIIILLISIIIGFIIGKIKSKVQS